MIVRRNYWVISLSLLLVLLLLTSCQNGLIPIGSKKKAELQGTLRIGLYSGNTGLNKPYEAGSRDFYQMQEKMKEFMKQNPKVKLVVVDLPYWFNLKSYMAGRSASGFPDIMELNVNEVRYSAQEVIENLNEQIERKLPDWKGTYEEVINTARLNGDRYLLPLRSDPMVAYYNQTVLDALGFAAPHNGWTWEEYAQLADKLNKKNIPVGIPYDLNSIEPVLRSLGGNLISPDNSHAVGYMDSEATVEAFTRYLEMMPKLTGILTKAKEQPGLGFARASNLGGLLGDQQSDYRVAPLPVSEDGMEYNNTLLTGLAIIKESENKELAWELLQFMAGDSSEEAMSFIVDNTLRMREPALDTKQLKTQELEELLKREVTNAQPSSYDMGIGVFGIEYFISPPRELNVISIGEAKKLLEEWAREIDAGIPGIYK